MTRSLDVEVTGFLSESQDLVARSSAPSPYLADALVQDGVGASYGAQVLLRQQQIGPFFGWISYTLMRSERQDHPGLDWRLFDYDQTHVFTALASYDLGHGLRGGDALPLRHRLSSHAGHRRRTSTRSPTPTSPIFGAHNSIRIPPFYALDVRVSKHFKIGKTQAEVYLDVQNVTDHANPEEIVYDPTYTQRGYITGLPILPVVGARWSW